MGRYAILEVIREKGWQLANSSFRFAGFVYTIYMVSSLFASLETGTAFSEYIPSSIVWSLYCGWVDFGFKVIREAFKKSKK